MKHSTSAFSLHVLSLLALAFFLGTPALPAGAQQEPKLRIPLKRARIPIGVLQGTVTDVKGRLVSAIITAEGGPNKASILVPVNPNTGAFEAKLSPGKYTLTIKAEGYTGASVDIEIKDRYRAKIPIKLRALPPPEQAKKAPPPPASEAVSVRYDRDATLGEELDESKVDKIPLEETIGYEPTEIMVPQGGTALLGKLAKLLSLDSNIVRIEITGHAHPAGDKGLEDRNALRRATYAKNYLVEQGIDPARIRIEGKGSRVPRDPSGGPEAAQTNNRVEFVLWKLKQ